MKKKLTLRVETLRLLKVQELREVIAAGNSGSQPGGSATCPPPKNGEGSGCVTL